MVVDSQSENQTICYTVVMINLNILKIADQQKVNQGILMHYVLKNGSKFKICRL